MIDEKPTGSKDPYALRRAALGVIRIVLSNRLRIPLMRALEYPFGFLLVVSRSGPALRVENRVIAFAKSAGLDEISEDISRAVIERLNVPFSEDHNRVFLERASDLLSF